MCYVVCLERERGRERGGEEAVPPGVVLTHVAVLVSLQKINVD